jgi:4'-phosphopantetheinyl transferase
MTALAWLSRTAADVPPGEAWLGERERAVLDTLTVAPRRDSWRLGRWTAKCAVGAWAGVPAEAVEVAAAPDGAPEAWVGGDRAGVSLSISHRAGRGIAAVAECAVGCDLEVVEPRSDAFLREWLAEPEREFVTAGDRALRANLVWTAKEAAAKVRREGLRLDVRGMVARPACGEGEWAPVEVAGLRGWWRAEPGWVMAIVSEPAGEPPRRL